MRGLFLALALVLTGCATQEAGRSPYLEEPFVPDARQQDLFDSRQAEADRILAATLAQQQERQQLGIDVSPDNVFVGGTGLAVQPGTPGSAPGTDASLVASLEAAIESAGASEGGAAPALSANTNAELAASAPPVTLREDLLNTPQPAEGEVATAVSPRITDNSFGTVTQRETIESDAQRLAALSQERVIVEAEPLPNRDTSVNLAAFARATQHRIGQRVYARGSSRRDSSRAARTCRSYGNPDEAQRAFLAAGGPDEDPMQLDPDGDGFVCGWSPLPFRSLSLGSG